MIYTRKHHTATTTAIDRTPGLDYSTARRALSLVLDTLSQTEKNRITAWDLSIRILALCATCTSCGVTTTRDKVVEANRCCGLIRCQPCHDRHLVNERSEDVCKAVGRDVSMSTFYGFSVTA